MKKLYVRDEETGDELEVGPITGIEVDADSPNLVSLALKTKVRYERAAAVVDYLRPGYHPNLDREKPTLSKLEKQR